MLKSLNNANVVFVFGQLILFSLRARRTNWKDYASLVAFVLLDKEQGLLLKMTLEIKN